MSLLNRTNYTSYPVSDYLEWFKADKLVLDPAYQRRPVWTDIVKSYLIDTVLKGLPMPPIFIREKLDLRTRQKTREVVDGQQRLRSIIDYYNSKFRIMKMHDEDLYRVFFEQLNDETKKSFLNYQIPTYRLFDVSDAEVLAVFSRLNTYTVTLNDQEKRNANFSGQFKGTVYDLGFKHVKFWLDNGIISMHKMKRMAEAQLVSEIVMAMLYGICSTRKKDIDTTYRNNEKKFPQKKTIVEQFDRVIDEIARTFGGRLEKTPLATKRPLFYGVFLLFFDMIYGLHGSRHQRVRFNNNTRASIRESLLEMANHVQSKPPEGSRYSDLYDDLRAASADVPRRKRRNEALWNVIGFE